MSTSTHTLRTHTQFHCSRVLLATAVLAAFTGCSSKGGSSSDTGESLDGMTDAADLELFAEYSDYAWGLESDEDNLYMLDADGDRAPAQA